MCSSRGPQTSMGEAWRPYNEPGIQSKAPTCVSDGLQNIDGQPMGRRS